MAVISNSNRIDAGWYSYGLYKDTMLEISQKLEQMVLELSPA